MSQFRVNFMQGPITSARLRPSIAALRATQDSNYHARYYDTNVGRFLSGNPFGSGGGINFYAYAGNNAPSLKDVFGLDYTTSRNGL
jgi:RHS repeat-associated protein